jgi:hypothetical protein
MTYARTIDGGINISGGAENNSAPATGVRLKPTYMLVGGGEVVEELHGGAVLMGEANAGSSKRKPQRCMESLAGVMLHQGRMRCHWRGAILA